MLRGDANSNKPALARIERIASVAERSEHAGKPKSGKFWKTLSLV
jgi:hypothetical protein